MTARGFKLITRAQDRMFAVSESWGCTGTHSDLRIVIAEALEIIGFIEWVNRQA